MATMIQLGLTAVEQEVDDLTGTRCVSRTRREGFDIAMSWGNTVVHVSLDGKTDVLQDPAARHQNVQYLAEQFGYLFVFRDYMPPRVYSQDGGIVKVLKHAFESFTCRGVYPTCRTVFFSQMNTNKIIAVDKDLTETVVPGSEGTSDFVVLKDERLFWITKSFEAHCGGRQKKLKDKLKTPHITDGNCTVAVLSSGNALVSFDAQELAIVSPELEIIDSLVNNFTKNGSYHMRIARTVRLGLDLAFLHVSTDIIGVAVRRNKVHLLKPFKIGHNIYSMSKLLFHWAICGESKFTLLKINFI